MTGHGYLFVDNNPGNQDPRRSGDTPGARLRHDRVLRLAPPRPEDEVARNAQDELAAAAALGLLASQHLPVEAAVLLVAAAALLFQPAQRRLERLADRWVFGARLDGYEVLTRFGAMPETSPRPADLMSRLAAAIRDGLGLQWALARLDLTTAGGPLPTSPSPSCSGT